MADYAAYYPTGASINEAWIRISTTQLRKKLYKRWVRKYVGINGPEAAEEVLADAILEFANVSEGTATATGGGLWEVEITILEEEWTDQYLNE